MDGAATESTREAALWRRLREDGDQEARQSLLETHLPYARVLAATYYGRRYNDDVEFADFLQYARLGMLEAVDRFDPSRGVQFRTFAARRMHGAILNGLEHSTEKHQQIAARRRIRNERLQEIKAAAGDDAGVPEDGRQLLRYVAEVGIGLALCWILEGTGLVEDGEASVAVPFYQPAALKQLRQSLVHAVAALPEQERQVVQAHYLQDLSFVEVAARMQVTKGRVSQIHRQALLHLRALVREHADWSSSF